MYLLIKPQLSFREALIRNKEMGIPGIVNITLYLINLFYGWSHSDEHQ